MIIVLSILLVFVLIVYYGLVITELNDPLDKNFVVIRKDFIPFHRTFRWIDYKLKQHEEI